MKDKQFLVMSVQPKVVKFRIGRGDKTRTGSEPHDGTLKGAGAAVERIREAVGIYDGESTLWYV